MATRPSLFTAPAPTPAPWVAPTADELDRDLLAGRDLPPRPADRVLALSGTERPTLGGLRSRVTAVTALALGRIRPRLARRALGRLWFTPWTHPAAGLPVDDAGMDARTWRHQLGSTRLQGWQAGRGPTAVLVHGWGSRAADLRHVAADLVAAGWRVVLPDLPGHGRSDRLVTDIDELRDAVAAVLVAERPRLVVAHSLGALATLLAVEQGGHVPAGIAAIAQARSAEHALATFARRLRLRPAMVAELRAAIEDRLGTRAWARVDAERVATGLDIPGLVVQDADDREVQFADAQAIVAAWAGPVSLVPTTGLGHRRILADAATRSAVVAFARRVRHGVPTGDGSGGGVGVEEAGRSVAHA